MTQEMTVFETQRVVDPTHARLNITWRGGNGDLPDPVPSRSSEIDVRRWATEAIRGGNVPGIAADANADLTDFVVDRFAATEDVPYDRIFVRPKTPFGGGKPPPGVMDAVTSMHSASPSRRWTCRNAEGDTCGKVHERRSDALLCSAGLNGASCAASFMGSDWSQMMEHRRLVRYEPHPVA